MKNENRVVFDRASEPCGFPFELPPATGGAQSAADGDRTTLRSAGSRLARLAALLVKAWQRRHDRMALLELDDDQLKDIGISRSQAYGGYSRYRRSTASELEKACR